MQCFPSPQRTGPAPAGLRSTDFKPFWQGVGAKPPSIAIHSIAFSTLLAAQLLLAPAAHAQAGAACNAQGTPPERNACVVHSYQQADTALTMLYGDVMTALSAHERPLLRSDQNQWLRARQGQCRQSLAAQSQRSDYDALYHQCLLDRIALRRAALMHWLHHGEAPPAQSPAALARTP